MSKERTRWHSSRLGGDVQVVRWGVVGTPVLVFSTAGGDAEEIERFLLVDALSPLLAARRLKVYSVDSAAGRVWLTEDRSVAGGARAQERFDAFLVHELVPAIRKDCKSESIEVVAAGASIGAYNALAAICRHPELFSHAICMSGTYDLSRFLDGPVTDDLLRISPLHFLPKMGEGETLEKLRKRFVLLAHGQGRWEDPSQSWRAAEALGARGVPNRVDAWGGEWDHDWPTWRAMLPRYLEELVPEAP